MRLRDAILRWGLNTGLLRGITFGKWLRLLRENRFAVDFRYFPRAAVITGASLANSALAAVERLRYGDRIRRTEIQPLLMILGTPRSGTSMLLQILSRDPRFAYPSFFNVHFPSTFLVTEKVVPRLLEPLLGGKRLQDNVPVTMQTADETEHATAVLSLKSLHLAWFFHGRDRYYARYITFDEASEEDRAEWQEALLYFYRKLSWRYRRPLVVKTPGDMGRLRLLTKLFPEARYVHICRHPDPVVQSAVGSYGLLREFAPLQADRTPFGEEDLESVALDRYRQLTRNYFRDRELIPPERLVEIRYEDFLRDPLRHLEMIYERLGLPDFGAVRDGYAEYLATFKDYRTTRHKPLPDRLRDRIRAECADCFERWGYAMDPAPDKE